MERNFCHLCGTRVQQKSNTTAWCPTCHQIFYVNPKPGIEIALLTTDGQILLCERAADPAKGKYDLCGGFIDVGESAEEAIAREIEEELGLKPSDYTTPQYLTSWHGTYQWGKENYAVIHVTFVAYLQTKTIEPHDDVASMKLVPLNSINESELSHEEYVDILKQVAEWHQANKQTTS